MCLVNLSDRKILNFYLKMNIDLPDTPSDELSQKLAGHCLWRLNSLNGYEQYSLFISDPISLKRVQAPLIDQQHVKQGVHCKAGCSPRCNCDYCIYSLQKTKSGTRPTGSLSQPGQAYRLTTTEANGLHIQGTNVRLIA